MRNLFVAWVLSACVPTMDCVRRCLVVILLVPFTWTAACAAAAESISVA